MLNKWGRVHVSQSVRRHFKAAVYHIWSQRGKKKNYLHNVREQEYSGMFLLGSYHLCASPWLLAPAWPLACLFDGWLYDTILVGSVTEGLAARAQAMRPFAGYIVTRKDVRRSLMNPHNHVEHAELGGEMGAPERSTWLGKRRLYNTNNLNSTGYILSL